MAHKTKATMPGRQWDHSKQNQLTRVNAGGQKGSIAVCGYTPSGRYDNGVLLNRRKIAPVDLPQLSGSDMSRFARISGQPFGSMPCFLSSARPSSFSQLLVLVFSTCANSSNCLRNSVGMRIGSMGDFPPPLGCLSLDIDMHMPIGLSFMRIGIYTNMYKSIKTTPRSAGTLPGRLTTALNQ
ncbi:hypothetical protein [Trabulsiella odontotermitis]|uniref:hypothetical protein n=1 Tax=Trabulsiella odontotermitis TaxID=379893 RepID=UPI003211C35D